MTIVDQALRRMQKHFIFKEYSISNLHNMKRVLVIVLTLVIGQVLITGQPLENGLLWKISGKGLEVPSYLYGTFHLLCMEDLVITDETKEAFNSCEQLVLELDVDNPGTTAEVQKGMFLPDGLTAKDYLTEDEYSLVEDFFTSDLEIPFEAIAGIKPFFLSSMIFVYFMECQHASPEMRFNMMADLHGISVLGLETAEDQLAFVDQIPLEDAAKMLVMSINEARKGDNMTAEMVKTYKEGNLNGIQEIIETYFGEEYSELNNQLIISRNLDWVQKVEEMITGKASFIAVGAGHLPGEKGLIRLLREKGYTVKPVK